MCKILMSDIHITLHMQLWSWNQYLAASCACVVSFLNITRVHRVLCPTVHMATINHNMEVVEQAAAIVADWLVHCYLLCELRMLSAVH